MTFKVIRLERNHMATTFDFRISCSADRAALADRTLTAAHLLVAQLETELTEFQETSPVYQLNHAQPDARVLFTEAGIALLKRAFELSRLSQGAFNPLAKSTASSPNLNWDEATLEVWKETAGTWLGFGAIGKGYAIDRARAMVEDAGFESYLLSGGGSSIVISGQQAPEKPWKWGWSWKKDADGKNLGIPLTHFSGKRIALGVSGTHEKGNHVVGARSNLKTALIALPSATDADALSTALFVSGWDDSKSFLGELPLAPAAAWIDEQETPYWNGVFETLWKGAMSTVFAAISLFSLLSVHAHSALCDESVDLGALDAGSKSFTPYVFDRSGIWVLLPIFMFLVVASHLKKTKPKRQTKGSLTKPMKKNATPLTTVLVASLTWLSVENASAAEIEPMNKAILAILGTPKATKKEINDGKGNVPVYYSKGADGKPQKVAFIEKGIYAPDCTHTWAIGLDGATGKIT